MTSHATTSRATLPRRRARLVAAALLLTASLAGLAAVPAAADPGLSPQRPLAELELSLAPTASPVIGPSTVTLTCTPDGGTHPTPKAACDALRSVGGDFERLPSVPGVHCPTVWDPHIARATGHWQQSPTGRVILVDYREQFGNRCEAEVGTDYVFRF